MKSVFYIPYVNNTLEKFRQYNINFLTKEDIYNKVAYKKIKKASTNIAFIEVLSLFMLSSKESFFEMMKRFFPLKCEELIRQKSEGIDFEIMKAFYNNEDGKIHWSVKQGDNIREFKLRTDMYLKRTKEEREKILDYIKKELDKLYGYFIEGNVNENFFITDKNNHNGNYKKIVETEGYFIHIIKNVFCPTTIDINDLKVL